MSTALDRSFDRLTNILLQNRQMQAQQVQQDRANRLSDLQFRQVQREDDYQTGLRGAMANPPSTTQTTIAPDRPQLSLASLVPGNQLQPQQFEQPGPQVGPLASRVSTQTVQQTPGQAGIEYARRNNRPEDVIKLVSMETELAKYAAQGDPVKFQQAKMELEEGTKFFETIKPYAKNPAMLKQIWPQVQQMFPKQTTGIKPESVMVQGNALMVPLEMNGQIVPNRGVFYDEEGKSHIIDTTPKPDQEALIDKRFANQQKLQSEQIAAQDRRTQAQIASAERKAGSSDKTDAIVAREVVKDLPKLRREARTAEASKPRLAQMISLIDSGAGGIKGNALAAISGVFDTPATSEAELFKKLAAAGAGQLRTSVIGPGAVSNYEQSLLQAISGGGNGARTATRQLLKFYDQEADRVISNYNDAVDSAVTVAPKAARGFGKLTGSAAPAKTGGKDSRPPLSAIFGTKKR